MESSPHHVLIFGDEDHPLSRQLEQLAEAEGLWSPVFFDPRGETDRLLQTLEQKLDGVILVVPEELDTALEALKMLGNFRAVVIESGDVRAAVEATRSGADHVVEYAEAQLVDCAAELARFVHGSLPATSDPRRRIVCAEHSPMQDLLELLLPLSRVDTPVLLHGEAGSGKQLLARTLHQLGPRGTGPFVHVNCHAIEPALLDSELFGHRAGSITGALRDKHGQATFADGGTLFLDNFGSLPLSTQGRLFELLNHGRFVPVGDEQSKQVDIRMIVSTTRSLEDLVARGQMLDDLFYALNTLLIEIPPLRERSMDISPLTQAAIIQHNQAHGSQIEGIEDDALLLLKRLHWPGNVRELFNVIERLCIVKRRGMIQRKDLSAIFEEDSPLPPLGLDVPSEGIDMPLTLEALETRLLEQALKKAEGNKARAARLLGLNRTTLVEKLKRKQIALDK